MFAWLTTDDGGGAPADVIPGRRPSPRAPALIHLVVQDDGPDAQQNARRAAIAGQFERVTTSSRSLDANVDDDPEASDDEYRFTMTGRPFYSRTEGVTLPGDEHVSRVYVFYDWDHEGGGGAENPADYTGWWIVAYDDENNCEPIYRAADAALSPLGVTWMAATDEPDEEGNPDYSWYKMTRVCPGVGFATRGRGRTPVAAR